MGMMTPSREVIEQLGRSFKCPKCRGDQGHVRRVQFPKTMFSKLLRREPGEFAFVTCTLCGYTETYDLAVYARLTDRAKQEAESKAASTQQA